MNITVKYFASMRESIKKNEECIDTNAPTINSLLEEVIIKYNLQIIKEDIKAAINHEYVPMEQSLEEDQTIAFIPPVAGG